MKSEIPGPPKLEGRTDLSLRITGIVFWGMTLAGLLISLVAMNSWDDELETRLKVSIAETENLIRNEFAHHPEILSREGQLQGESNFEKAFRNGTLSGLRIVWPKGHFQGGVATGNPIAANDIYALDSSGQENPIRIEYFQPDRASTASGQRKHILIFASLLAMVFGFILQFILKRILTDPLNQMVESAMQIAKGNKGIRFKDSGSNEFAFLSGFINQAIDAAQNSEAALHREKERIEVTLKSISDAVIATDADARIQFMNPLAERLTGYEIDIVRGKPISMFVTFIDELSRECIEDPACACLRHSESIKLDKGSELLVNKKGLEIPVSGTASLMTDAADNKIGCVIALQDVRESREMMHKLFHQASRDSLTGLYNRQSFEAQLKHVLESEEFAGRDHALLYLDLDQFKVVNDTGGHTAGDELLHELSEALHRCLRQDDVLARLGGDEFGVLLKLCDSENALGVAEKLRKCVEEFRFSWGGNVFQIGVSIGLISFVSGDTNLIDMLSCADLACYAAKEAGRNRIHVYTPTDDTLSIRHSEMRWVSYLNRALDEDLFEIFLQPIISLDSKDKHRHWEVLLRLPIESSPNHACPGAFLPAAERYGLITKIDRWVITKTLQYFSKAKDNLLSHDEFFSINLSGASLSDPSLADFVKDVQKATEVPWNTICFEVTETVAIRNLAVGKSFIEEMRAHGCKFSLDDFGSGLSSFAYLKNLPVDYLKIDGAFVRDVENDPVDRAMVEAILQVGRIMGIKTIAEWAENEGISDILREIGIDYAQGYFFGEPAPIQHYISKADDLSA